MFGGDLDRRIVVVVEFVLLMLVGDETALSLRIDEGLLYNANPGLVVSESSVYYIINNEKNQSISSGFFINFFNYSHLFFVKSQSWRI